MRPLKTAIPLTVLAAALACPVACAPQDGPRPAGAADARIAPGPFAPASIRVHPLTHLEHDERGRVRLALHLEMRDQWGDTVKGAGMLRVRLFRATGLGGAGGEEQERLWELDLRDLDTNRETYDPSTRTYRIWLTGLPAWLEQASLDPEPRAGATTRGRIVATLRTPGPDGAEHALRDEHALQR